MILEKCNISFSFKTVCLPDVEKEIKSSDTNSASHSSDVPTKILNMTKFPLFLKTFSLNIKMVSGYGFTKQSYAVAKI